MQTKMADMASGNLNLVDLKITMDGKEFNIQVSPEIYQKAIDEDQETIQWLYASCSPSTEESANSQREEIEYDGGAAEAEDIEQAQAEDDEVTVGYGKTKWSSEAILLMLSLYVERKAKFANSAYKNKDLWRQIGEEMRQKGQLFTGLCCDKKFRSMKHRHKTICDANAKSGRGNNRWEWFTNMDEILAGDPAVQPVRLVSSAMNGTEQRITGKPPLPGMRIRTPTPPNCRTPSPLACPPTPIGRAATPPVRQILRPSPPVTEAEQSIEEGVTPARKRRRSSSSQEPPEWFSSYIADQSTRWDRMETYNERIVTALEERNTLMRELVNAFKDKQ